MADSVSKGDIAYENFLKGYNCTQAIAVTFAKELGLDEAAAARLSSGFGGGMGRLREVCGTFSGVVFVLSSLYGYSEPKDLEGKKDLYEKIRACAAKFRSDNGSIICRELLGLEKAEESATPEPRTAEYYKKRPCPELCRYAGNLIEDFIRDNPPQQV
ncbi:MAG: C-GCAxxG-C-C family protein [Oscillospiraceae bacterium]|nr:C-GCAxxG-C-C family protein [Oscillospiraceae bacterium]